MALNLYSQSFRCWFTIRTTLLFGVRTRARVWVRIDSKELKTNQKDLSPMSITVTLTQTFETELGNIPA